MNQWWKQLRFGIIALLTMLSTPAATQADTMDSGIVSRAINDMALSSDGSTLLTASSDGKAVMWNTQSGRQQRVLSYPMPLYAVAFSSDGKRFAFGGAAVVSGTVRGIAKIFDVASGREHNAFFSSAPVSGIAFSPDGQTLLSVSRRENYGSPPGELALWSTPTGQRLRTLQKVNGDYARAAFSSDGKIIVCAVADGLTGHGDLTIRDAATGRLRSTLIDEEAYHFAISPDNTMIASRFVYRDEIGKELRQTMRIWNLQNGKLLREIKLAGWIWGAAFAPNGKTLAVNTSRNDRERLDIIDVTTGRVLRSWLLQGHTARMLYSRDGDTIYLAGNSGTNGSAARLLALNANNGRRLWSYYQP